VERLAYSVYFKMDITSGELVDYDHVQPSEVTDARMEYVNYY
jgi:hypothetical protein